MAYTKDLYDFIKMSKYAGMREDYVQAAGGNTSVKTSKGEMIVKASGYQLTEVDEDKGYAGVRYADIVSYIEQRTDTSEEEDKEALNKSHTSGDRPSIETYLHALIPYKYVLHTHSVWAGILLARRNGKQELEALFPECMYVYYHKPGAKLARYMYQLMRERDGSDIVFLENHGVIVSGDSVEEVIDKHEALNEKMADYLSIDIKKYKNVTYLYKKIIKHDQSFNKVVYLVTSSDCSIDVGSGMPSLDISPDSVVYCGRNVVCEPLVRMSDEDVVICFDDSLYIIAENIRKAKEIESILTYTALVNNFNRDQAMRAIKPEEVDDLLGWEAEKYRRERT